MLGGERMAATVTMGINPPFWLMNGTVEVDIDKAATPT